MPTSHIFYLSLCTVIQNVPEAPCQICCSKNQLHLHDFKNLKYIQRCRYYCMEHITKRGQGGSHGKFCDSVEKCRWSSLARLIQQDGCRNLNLLRLHYITLTLKCPVHLGSAPYYLAPPPKFIGDFTMYINEVKNHRSSEVMDLAGGTKHKVNIWLHIPV